MFFRISIYAHSDALGLIPRARLRSLIFNATRIGRFMDHDRPRNTEPIHAIYPTFDCEQDYFEPGAAFPIRVLGGSGKNVGIMPLPVAPLKAFHRGQHLSP